jgi:hypothetical protein
MVHEVKNIKTKLPRLEINIGFWLRLAAFSAVIGVLWACGGAIYVISAYLIIKILRLVLRFFGQILSLVYTAVSIAILILIISYLIF